MRYSFHHMADPDLALAEIVRVAKPGARVAIADMVLPRAQADAGRVREAFEADVGEDRMGLSLQRVGGVISLTYPVTIVAGSKQV